MNRRDFLKHASAATTGLSLASAGAAATPAPEKRNVILFISDDQGRNDAGCYGNPHLKTPGLDALAQDAVRFTHGFCTTPSCSPSRSVLLTGLHNHANGQYGLAHATHHFVSFDAVKSLPVLLGDVGYRTVNAGKYHTLPEPVYHFQKYIPVASPIDMAEQCRDLIAADDPKPFFLCFCTTEPHRTFNHEGFTPPDPNSIDVPSHLPDLPETRRELADYYASVQRADSGLAKLIEILKAAGRWEDTLIVYVSDNGMPWPGAKTTLYEPGINLPCVIRNPKNERHGYTCNAMFTWADIAPTILDYCGIAEGAEAMQGRSILHAMTEEQPAGWDEIFLSHSFHEVTMYYPMRAVRTRKHKLIFNIANGLEFPFASDLWKSATWQASLRNKLSTYGKRSVDAYLHRSRFEMYDLENDPDEIHNLVDDPKHADALADLKQRVRSFQERTNDPWALKWDRE